MELPEYRHDFPADPGRFVQRGCGYDKVIVNGQMFMERGEHTGALAGVTLRSRSGLSATRLGIDTQGGHAKIPDP